MNDGTADSGHEVRNAETLASYLRGPGVEMRQYEPHPGRRSLLLRVEGSDDSAPTLMLMGHTDVVPADPRGWSRDPFGGDLVDGVVWGRGAVDMLNNTASMAVAVKRLLRAGWRPRGTLLYLAVADEEALGTLGADWLVRNAWPDVRCDYLLTEFGGIRLPIPTRGAPKVTISVAEKGSHWVRLVVRGKPGHGSMPYRTDNAVVKMAEAIRRISRYRPPTRIHETWRSFVEAAELPPLLSFALLTPAALERVLPRLPPGVGRMVQASTHTTFSPNIAKGGVKTNVIADSAEIHVDIRTVPGDEGPQVREMLRQALGDLWPQVEIADEGDNPASASPIDTPLYGVLSSVTARLRPGTATVPFLIVGATDARYFRRKGVICYGYGQLSDRIPFSEFSEMFHGNDERIDLGSLRLSTLLWEHTARDFLG